jgi:hypothetical protein
MRANCNAGEDARGLLARGLLARGLLAFLHLHIALPSPHPRSFTSARLAIIVDFLRNQRFSEDRPAPVLVVKRPGALFAHEKMGGIMKRTIILVGLVLMLAATVVHADERLEITVHSGWSLMDIERKDPLCLACEDFFAVTTTVEGSPIFGTKAGYYLNRNTEVEGYFAVAPGHDAITDNSFECPPGRICPLADLYYPFFHIERNLISYQYGGSLIYNFTNSSIRPFASFGLGGVSSDVDQITHHDFTFQFGGGAKFYFGNIGLRIEVLDQVIPDNTITGDTEHEMQVQYGIVFGL